MKKKNKDSFLYEDDFYSIEVFYTYTFDSATYYDPEDEDLEVEKVFLTSKLLQKDSDRFIVVDTQKSSEIQWVTTDITDLFLIGIDTESMVEEILQKERDND